mmetsp:Transcript_14984/g.41454  ORF Transcript_14984/g.41454 Transcript_14984/m.41454 type:complete len:210 (-) Transcript_14984:223-852(-)
MRLGVCCSLDSLRCRQLWLPYLSPADVGLRGASTASVITNPSFGIRLSNTGTSVGLAGLSLGSTSLGFVSTRPGLCQLCLRRCFGTLQPPPQLCQFGFHLADAGLRCADCSHHVPGKSVRERLHQALLCSVSIGDILHQCLRLGLSALGSSQSHLQCCLRGLQPFGQVKLSPVGNARSGGAPSTRPSITPSLSRESKRGSNRTHRMEPR